MTKQNNNQGSSVNIREIVLELLLSVLEQEEYSHIALRETLKKYQYLSKQDRSFLSRLFEGCVERKLELDYILNQYSNTPVKKMKPVIRNILRMGVYQLLYMDQVPDSATCNEAVKLATKKGFFNLKGFVNGVLRNVARSKDVILYPKEDKEPIAYLSIRYSMPEWIVKSFLKEYDYETVKTMLNAMLSKKKTTIRCNLSKAEKEKIRTSLEDDQVTVLPGAYLDYAYSISDYNYITKLRAFSEGLFQVQDESSMLVAQVADIKKGDTVLDVCAAPGGKSLHAADILNGSGKVIARDLTDYKVALIQENVDRIGFTNIEVQKQDALILDKTMIEKADVVFADLPCSGLGVLSKKADIKYKMQESTLGELVKLQKDMLTTVSRYVKHGGTLIYSTCTIHSEENIKNVQWFMKEFDFSLESLNAYLPEQLHSDETSRGYLQLLPGVHSTDGFFLARLKRG